VGATLDGKTIVVIRQASEAGQFVRFGNAARHAGILQCRRRRGQPLAGHAQRPIKTIGLYKVPLALHPEVETNITVNRRAQRGRSRRVAAARTSRRREQAEEAASRRVWKPPKPLRAGSGQALREANEAEAEARGFSATDAVE